ncbi:MAG: amidohydrolase family protein [Candidatus Cloacimonetes bacterium]|nr:amidohydrolase family protein [Candidatus Cloacimonadota bacterium]
MIIKPSVSVISPDRAEQGIDLHLPSSNGFAKELRLVLDAAVAYIPLINAHDHLIGNWVPRAGDKRPYVNSHIWVEDMKNSFSFHERNIFWINDGSFQLSEPRSLLLAKLGAYKSLFSGCGIVQDHAPVQDAFYYDSMPINVPCSFRQCHSITLGNWWGGESPEVEMELTKGKIPFIIHLGEGTDGITKAEFGELLRRGLLRDNTLMIHGIAFSAEEIATIAMVGASVCWCPSSNYYLIGETLKIDEALKCKANVCIGTDSTMSGGVNLIAEFLTIQEHFPHIKPAELYRMVTTNAVKALKLPDKYASLNPANCDNLLLVDRVEKDPFENLYTIEAATIKLLIIDGIPRFGDSHWLEDLGLRVEEYSTFRTLGKEKFVIGDPQAMNNLIDEVLGYHKDFPYLPF